MVIPLLSPLNKLKMRWNSFIKFLIIIFTLGAFSYADMEEACEVVYEGDPS